MAVQRQRSQSICLVPPRSRLGFLAAGYDCTVLRDLFGCLGLAHGSKHPEVVRWRVGMSRECELSRDYELQSDWRALFVACIYPYWHSLANYVLFMAELSYVPLWPVHVVALILPQGRRRDLS